jgi:hypothetical protein
MPRVMGMALTVALKPTGGIGEIDRVDTDGVGTCWIMSLDVQEGYSPDVGGECIIGVSGRISLADEEELDGDDGDDGGEYNIGDDIGKDDSLGMSSSVSNNSVSTGSDSNASDSIKLKLSEWGDDRNEILELKELRERRLCGGGVSGMAMTPGLALPVTMGGVEG